MPAVSTAIRVELNDYDWHPVGSPEEQYKVRAISSNALEMCCTPADVIPTVDTPAFFWLGGQINNIITRPRFQNWIRATVIPSEYLQNPADEEGFDELTAIRAAIAELQTSAIKISNRVMLLENWRALAVRDWQMLKYQLNYRIDRIFKTLARLVNMDVKLLKEIHEVRMRLPAMNLRIDNLEVMKLDTIDFENKVEELLLAIAKNTKLSVEIISQLLNHEFSIIKCKEDIKILYETKTSGSGSGGSDPEDSAALLALTTKVDTMRSDLDMYWAVCIAMVSANSSTGVTTIYNNFISTHTVPDTIKSTLQFARDQALKIVSNIVIDATQEAEIADINEYINGMFIGQQITAADLQEIENSTP